LKKLRESDILRLMQQKEGIYKLKIYDKNQKYRVMVEIANPDRELFKMKVLNFFKSMGNNIMFLETIGKVELCLKDGRKYICNGFKENLDKWLNFWLNNLY